MLRIIFTMLIASNIFALTPERAKCISVVAKAVERVHDQTFADAHVAEKNVHFNEELGVYQVVATDEWAGSGYFVEADLDCNIIKVQFIKDLERDIILSL